mmetsp:Transcript_2460/g.5312  ORF Transcript_2460/g.5312 Transcript_2460/m.5312 type:complete len:129 (+) Transcript_2460:369-755(+)
MTADLKFPLHATGSATAQYIVTPQSFTALPLPTFQSSVMYPQVVRPIHPTFLLHAIQPCGPVAAQASLTWQRSGADSSTNKGAIVIVGGEVQEGVLHFARESTKGSLGLCGRERHLHSWEVHQHLLRL